MSSLPTLRGVTNAMPERSGKVTQKPWEALPDAQTLFSAQWRRRDNGKPALPLFNVLAASSSVCHAEGDRPERRQDRNGSDQIEANLKATSLESQTSTSSEFYVQL